MDNVGSIIEMKRILDKIFIEFFLTYLELQTINQALKLAKKYRYSYFDSLILASALEHDCSILYSEDMQHQQLIENKLTIYNPFVQ